MGPVLEVVTNYHQGKPRVEIGIESLFNDGSQSWIRISSGLNKFVRHLTDKIRIHEDNEDTLASMVRLHNSRLENCGKLSNKCRQTYLIIFSNWYSKSFKNMGWMFKQEGNVIRATRMQRGWIHCFDMNLFPEMKMEHLEVEDGLRVRISQFCILVNSNMDRPLTKRRRTKEKNSVLYWFYWWRNSLHPSYPRSFRRKFCGSIFTRQWIDSRQLLRVISICTLSLLQDW